LRFRAGGIPGRRLVSRIERRAPIFLRSPGSTLARPWASEFRCPGAGGPCAGSHGRYRQCRVHACTFGKPRAWPPSDRQSERQRQMRPGNAPRWSFCLSCLPSPVGGERSAGTYKRATINYAVTKLPSLVASIKQADSVNILKRIKIFLPSPLHADTIVPEVV